MGVTEEVGKVSAVAVGAMQSQPLAIALLIVNVMFLCFAGWVLNSVATNAAERNKTQMELIGRLVADCQRGSVLRPQGSSPSLPLPPLPAVPVHG